VVLMDDKPSKIALAIRIARRTLAIARQNVVFAIGVKAAVLILAAFGIATMWLAVFADVGVTVLAVLNAMRALRNVKMEKIKNDEIIKRILAGGEDSFY
jgi:Cd2+/Zn2+-exporting ATPase